RAGFSVVLTKLTRFRALVLRVVVVVVAAFPATEARISLVSLTSLTPPSDLGFCCDSTLTKGSVSLTSLTPKLCPYQELTDFPPTRRTCGSCFHTSFTKALKARWDMWGMEASRPLHSMKASYSVLVAQVAPATSAVFSSRNADSQS